MLVISALITGIGMISCLGEGVDAHWAALNRDGGFQPVLDSSSFAPWLAAIPERVSPGLIR